MPAHLYLLPEGLIFIKHFHGGYVFLTKNAVKNLVYINILRPYLNFRKTVHPENIFHGFNGEIRQVFGMKEPVFFAADEPVNGVNVWGRQKTYPALSQ